MRAVMLYANANMWYGGMGALPGVGLWAAAPVVAVVALRTEFLQRMHKSKLKFETTRV